MSHVTWRRVRAVVLAMCTAATLITVQSGAGAQVPGSTPAIVHNGTWYLRNSLTSGSATTTFNYGLSSDIPVMGDWDGDGDETPGVVRPTTGSDGITRYVWYLRNANSAGSANITFTYAQQRFVAVDQLGTIPVVGDWNGDGVDTPGVAIYDFSLTGPIVWHLRNSNTGGAADAVVTYSTGRDRPVAGDWDGNGTDSPGVVRGDTWLLRNSVSSGTADITFQYGSPSILELPVVGDWDGNGTDTPAVLRNNPPTDEFGGYEVWLFRNSNTGGAASGQITFGSDALGLDLPIETIPRMSWR